MGGDKLSVMSFLSFVNEIHVRIAVLNKFREFDRPHPRLCLKYKLLRVTLTYNYLCNKALSSF